MTAYSNSQLGSPPASPDRPATRRNERLVKAMADTGTTFMDLAAEVGLHYKSVQRWVYEGRRPQSRDTAILAAKALSVDADWLWPGLPRLANPDVINVYDFIHLLPPTMWHRLARSASRVIEIATDAAPILLADLSSVLSERASKGVEIRLCVGKRIESPLEIPGVATRCSNHDGMLSIFRFDAIMLVWMNCGGPGLDYLGPVLHLQRVEDNGLFDAYVYVFARLWSEGRAIKRPQ